MNEIHVKWDLEKGNIFLFCGTDRPAGRGVPPRRRERAKRRSCGEDGGIDLFAVVSDGSRRFASFGGEYAERLFCFDRGERSLFVVVFVGSRRSAAYGGEYAERFFRFLSAGNVFS